LLQQIVIAVMEVNIKLHLYILVLSVLSDVVHHLIERKGQRLYACPSPLVDLLIYTLNSIVWGKGKTWNIE